MSRKLKVLQKGSAVLLLGDLDPEHEHFVQNMQWLMIHEQTCMRCMKSNTFHLALAKFFSICAQTPSFMFLFEAAFPEILRKGTRKLFCYFFLATKLITYVLVGGTIYIVTLFLYHSWAMASWAVNRWSWSTSIKDATKFLALKKWNKQHWTCFPKALNTSSVKYDAIDAFEWTDYLLPASEMSSQYGESNS